MELGQILYAVAIVAYFIYKATAKKKGTTLPEDGDLAPESPQKGLTFEDLLREIRESQVPKAEKVPSQKTEPAVDQRTLPKQSFKTKEKIPPIVEEVMAEGQDYEEVGRSYREKLDRTSLEGLPSNAPKQILFETNEKRINPYASLLKNRKSFRDAVIVSEILQTKHF
uniref:hypothetical protein n=1 Tax=Algoriphagus sp. TaxID=1872435 RepID=UPI00404773B5